MAENENAASIHEQIVLVRNALGRIAHTASVWPPRAYREAQVVEFVTDASEALERLEALLGLQDSVDA